MESNAYNEAQSLLKDQITECETLLKDMLEWQEVAPDPNEWDEDINVLKSLIVELKGHLR